MPLSHEIPQHGAKCISFTKLLSVKQRKIQYAPTVQSCVVSPALWLLLFK